MGAKVATTQWSQVLAARDGSDTEARRALESLCQTYWQPLYAYIRHPGFGLEEAQDLTQGYFAELQKHYEEAATALILDLSDLKSADKTAIRWLGERLARGNEIVGASPYIKFLLEREQPNPNSLAATGSRGSSEDSE